MKVIFPSGNFQLYFLRVKIVKWYTESETEKKSACNLLDCVEKNCDRMDSVGHVILLLYGVYTCASSSCKFS